MENNNPVYIEKFPYESIRDQQKTAIDFALKTLVSENKKFCVIEAGTGVGKSAVGLTVARIVSEKIESLGGTINGSYFLTTQKILQDQYENDFSDMVSLKSSTNYKCSYHKKNTCAESQTLLRTEERGTRFFNSCAFDCVYKNKKKKFLESSESITNFPYFLTEASYSGKITK